MNVVELQQEIKSREEQSAVLERRRSGALINIEGLELERKKLIVPARAGNNKAAQERINLLDGEIFQARRGMADDDAAIAQINQQIDEISQQVSAEEEKEERSRMRKIVSAAAKRARENSGALSRLSAGLEQSADELLQLNGLNLLEGVSLDLRHLSTVRSLLGEIEGTHAEARAMSYAARLEQVAYCLESLSSKI
jgi:hypothetical protein